MYTPGCGFLHHASSIINPPFSSYLPDIWNLFRWWTCSWRTFSSSLCFYTFFYSFTIILARFQVGMEINMWYLPPGALRLPAPIWTGCSVGLQHNCHPGTSLHYSSGLDPIFPGPYIFLFVSLLLCSGLCSCSPPSIPLLPHCINSCAIWVELTPLPALGIELYDINQSE